MPYVVDTRYAGSHMSLCSFGTASLFIDSPTSLEVTYGFRTGKRANGSDLDDRDIYRPPEGAGIAAILAYRKKFIERQVTLLSLDSDNKAPTHFVLSDLGHEFASYKMSAFHSDNRISWKTSTGGLREFTNAVIRDTAFINNDGSGGHSGGRPPVYHDPAAFMYRKKVPFWASNALAYPSLAQARAIGTEDIKGMNPIQSHAGVLTTLLEFMTGDVPGILKNLRTHFKTITDLRIASKEGLLDAGSTLGGSYLENVFGWTPIIKDIAASIEVLTSIDNLLYPPDSTRRHEERILRESSFGNQATGQTMVCAPAIDPQGIGIGTPPMNNTKQIGAPSKTATGLTVLYSAHEKIDVRTTVRFQTGLIPNSLNNGFSDKLQDLLGLELTPKVLWDITPWSWLIDWFSNIGSVVENLSNIHASNLILNYAYSTFRRKAESGAIASRPAIVSSGGGFYRFDGDLISRFESDQKVRLKASPYGFDVSLASLSESQWAILVALGLARSR